MTVSGRAGELESLFDHCFSSDFNTRLIGGSDEPLYLPAGDGADYHRIFYREDYFSSALHEVAHWCIAGNRRRLLVDFGYWYNPDGRTAGQQRAFEKVEIKPQALEWIFSAAAGISFTVSADNLAAGDGAASRPSRKFLLGIEARARDYCRDGLPDRAARFASAVAGRFGTGYGDRTYLDPDVYSGGLTT